MRSQDSQRQCQSCPTATFTLTFHDDFDQILPTLGNFAQLQQGIYGVAPDIDKTNRYSMMQQGVNQLNNAKYLSISTFEHFPWTTPLDMCSSWDRILTVHLLVREISLWHPGT